MVEEDKHHFAAINEEAAQPVVEAEHDIRRLWVYTSIFSLIVSVFLFVHGLLGLLRH